MDGYLLIDKPKGWTSFDVVNKLRFMLANASGLLPKSLKVGHGGTLDPNATGLLIVLVGSYTKRQAEFMKQDKIYLAEVTLGATSTTDDADGEITKRSVKTKPTKAEINRVLEQLIGNIQQTPPQYSAIKLKGKKAYELARAGQTAELKARSVTVHLIDRVSYKWPDLRFRAIVSSGTYIRSLARDIGELTGVGGYLKELRRESIGPYQLSDALKLQNLDADAIKSRLRTLE